MNTNHRVIFDLAAQRAALTEGDTTMAFTRKARRALRKKREAARQDKLFTVRCWNKATPLGGETYVAVQARDEFGAELDAEELAPDFENYEATEGAQ